MLCQIDIAHSTGPEQSRNAIPGEQLALPERHSRMIREPQSARGSLDAGAALTSSLTPQPLVLAVGRSGSEVGEGTGESRFTQFAGRSTPHQIRCGRAKKGREHATALPTVTSSPHISTCTTMNNK